MGHTEEDAMTANSVAANTRGKTILRADKTALKSQRDWYTKSHREKEKRRKDVVGKNLKDGKNKV